MQQFIEFADKTALKVIRISGGREFHRGHLRDTLMIDLKPADCSFQNTLDTFRDSSKTKQLFSISESDEIDKQKYEIGTNYTILLSAGIEFRDVPVEPGHISPVEIEEVYTVKIAQKTFEELLLENLITEMKITPAALKMIAESISYAPGFTPPAQEGQGGAF